MDTETYILTKTDSEKGVGTSKAILKSGLYRNLLHESVIMIVSQDNNSVIFNAIIFNPSTGNLITPIEWNHIKHEHMSYNRWVPIDGFNVVYRLNKVI